MGLVPQTPSTASRVAVPVYANKRQVGRATSTTWSPLLKKMIALASVQTEHSQPGTRLQMEFTIEAVRHSVAVYVTKLPFFNPPRKTATPAP
jgi:aminomethyltransferase